jgi:BRCT domain type II-containing protein
VNRSRSKNANADIAATLKETKPRPLDNNSKVNKPQSSSNLTRTAKPPVINNKPPVISKTNANSSANLKKETLSGTSSQKEIVSQFRKTQKPYVPAAQKPVNRNVQSKN